MLQIIKLTIFLDKNNIFAKLTAEKDFRPQYHVHRTYSKKP
jgi:hypothetical protein